MRMNNPAEQVRFMDDLDLNFAMDSRQSTNEHRTSIEMDSKPIVFRASYRDILLITSIANRAMELSEKSSNISAADDKPRPSLYSSDRARLPDRRNILSQEPRVIMSKEQVRFHP